MLFDSALRKELGRSFGATVVIMVTIVMTMMLVRTLGLASRGRVDPSEVLLVLGFTVLGHLPTILTLSLFVAITATLTRMYASSEMVVWFACGQGLASFLRPILRFAWPVLLGVAVLALVVWPWSNQQVIDLRTRYEQRGDIDRVAPGRFQESAGGRRVFFIDRDVAQDQSGSNIFISATEKDRESVTSAATGKLVTEGTDRFLVLSQGQRLDVFNNTGEARLSEFREYGTRVDSKVLPPTESVPPRVRSTWSLARDPTRSNLSELSWRIGLALAAFNCVLIALASTRVNPRVGRSAGLIFALFAFASYYNLLNVGQSWIANGRVGFAAWLLLLHGGILLAAGGWLLLRHNNLSLSPTQWLRLRSAA